MKQFVPIDHLSRDRPLLKTKRARVRVLMNQGLCSNGPKAELVQRVYNYIQIIREAKGLPAESAEMAHVQDVLEN